jgi:hypothetical protein
VDRSIVHVVEEKARLFELEEEERRVNPFRAPPRAGPRLKPLPVPRYVDPTAEKTSVDRIPLVAEDDPLYALRVR